MITSKEFSHRRITVEIFINEMKDPSHPELAFQYNAVILSDNPAFPVLLQDSAHSGNAAEYMALGDIATFINEFKQTIRDYSDRE